MPHLTVYANEADLADREAETVTALTDAVVEVYGEWARAIAVVQLIGMPAGRWGIGGRLVDEPAPRVTFGIRDAAFSRPDADDIVARLTAGVTDALVSVFGERIRSATTVELVGTPEGRMSVGGRVG